MANLSKEQIMIEYVRCMKDTPYALNTYLQTYDNTVSKYVPLELFPDQITLLEDYENYNENIALKYRQAGVSTVTSAWVSKKLAFAKKEKPEKILIIANKLDTSIEMANKIRAFVTQWPSWVSVGIDPNKKSTKHWKLNNGCEVKAVATSKDALRGFTPTILIFDEAAFIEADSDFWSACMASLSTGGKVIVVSTPNGNDPIYYEIYDQALRGMNDFKITEMYWYRDPRYTKDLYFVKTDDAIHYLLNKDEYDSTKIISWADIEFKDRNFDDVKELINNGYKPCSDWFEKMVKKLKYDKRKVSQELECVDGDTLVTVKDTETNEIKEIRISDLYNVFKLEKYKILSPEGFVDFDGIQKLSKKTIELTFDNNLTLRGSLNHKVYSFDGNEILIKDIKINDKLKSHDGFLTVKNIVTYDHETDVYDVINAGKLHLYYTNTIISHNCNFLGSGDNVFDSKLMMKIKENYLKEPDNKMMNNQLWIWKEPVIGHKYILGCLPPDEKVLTDKGLKNVQDVDFTDKLVSEKGDYVDIINRQIYPVENEPIYSIKVDNTYRRTTFTKEHPILISKPVLKRNYKRHDSTYKFNERYWEWDFKYTIAEDVDVNDWIKVPNIYKDKVIDNIDEKWKINEKIRYDFELDSPLKEKDFWWFIGMVLGDGWISKNKDSYSISICFNKVDDFYRNKSIEIVKRLFKRSPSIIDKDRPTIDITFNSKFLYYFILETFGKYSHGKMISEWVKYIPNELKVELIRGYFDSDGCWVKTFNKKKSNKTYSKMSFVSINLELLESIQDILFSLGIISSLNKLRDSKEGEIAGKKYIQRQAYNLCLANNDSLELFNLIYEEGNPKLNQYDINDFKITNKRNVSNCHFDKNKDFIFFKVKDIKKSEYTGYVYNFECDTNTFMCHHITTHNCDVSRGDSEDFSTFQIIDFDTREQVAEFVGKLPPDTMAEICYKWGNMYSAFIVVDITGGMGVSTSRKLQELGYKNLYVDGEDLSNSWKYNPKSADKIPGINFNNKRVQIIASYEECLRHEFKIYSSRLYNEMDTFVYINGRPDHQKGRHDDLLMAIAMTTYVGETSFSKLTKVTEQAKAMINSWSVNDNNTTKQMMDFNPVIPLYNDRQGQFSGQEISRKDYQTYGWLFGTNRRM